jgi:transposase-like protein
MAAKKKRRAYSDDDKANALAALAANGGNVAKTARQLKLPRVTLLRWSAGQVHPEVSNLGHQKRKALDRKLEDLAHRLVDALPGKIDRATLAQAAVALGIAIEKMRLLREQATDINADANLSDDERLARIVAILDRARERRTRQPSTADG